MCLFYSNITKQCKDNEWYDGMTFAQPQIGIQGSIPERGLKISKSKSWVDLPKFQPGDLLFQRKSYS